MHREAFYVSVRDGEKFGVLVGPCETHEEALGLVEATREEARSFDPFAHFYAYGTLKLDNDSTKAFPIGPLNGIVNFSPKSGVS